MFFSKNTAIFRILKLFLLFLKKILSLSKNFKQKENMEQFVFFLKSLTIKTIVFWLAIVYIAYMFSWVTAVPKILQHEGMVASMQNRGFMPIATLA